MNLGLGIVLGKALNNMAAGIAIGTALPDPFEKTKNKKRRK